MLTYLPDDSDRCRVKELMASARPALQAKTRDAKWKEQPRPPRLDFRRAVRPHKSMQA